jgi:hypothetical protein
MKLAYLLFLSLLPVGCSHQRPPEVREFPDGFRGWAAIVWDVPGYPELPIEEGKIIERFPADGLIITSSKEHFGMAHDEEYYIDAEGRRLPTHPRQAFGLTGRRGTQDECRISFSAVFIGTDAEHLAADDWADTPQGKAIYDRLCPAGSKANGQH